jgi:hypothetical protein
MEKLIRLERKQHRQELMTNLAYFLESGAYEVTPSTSRWESQAEEALSGYTRSQVELLIATETKKLNQLRGATKSENAEKA